MGARRRRSRRPAQMQKQRVPTRYEQFANQVDFNALASGGDIMMDIVNNSSQIGNVVARFNKITVQTGVNETMADQRHILVAVVRQSEGDSAPSLDNRATIRDLRNEGKLLRGPWMFSTYDANGSKDGPFTNFLKTIVLKNLTVDENDDIVMCFTNLDAAFSSTTQTIRNFVKMFFRVVS